ncbi:MAG: hypothetical protein JNM20_03130 [Rhizobiales bacterium]|nr:hypothetical protein [Hyphomicrobiales bacterium]
MARLQLELSDTYEALVEKLQPLCDLQTKKDVIENALVILGWAATETSRGLTIAAIDQDQRIFKEIHTAALEGAKTFAARNAAKEGTSDSAKPARKAAAAA